MNRVARHLVLIAFVLAGLAASATEAFATHFRYGTITWSTPNPSQPNVILVRFDSAWRRTFVSPAPNVNTVIPSASLGINLDILTAAGTASGMTSIPIAPTVTAINATEDWMSTTWSQQITLPGGIGTDFILQMTQCCRVSTLADANRDQTFTVRSRVTIRNPINRPPTSASLPIISVVLGQPVNFVVPAFDPDGDPLNYALTPISPVNESGMLVQAPAGASGPLQVNATTGRVTWTPNLPGLFSVQFKVTDSKGATGVIDILFQVLSAGVAGTPPVMTLNSVAPPPSPTFNVIRGSHLTFAIGASTNTSPASSVTLISSGLPIGANMSPSLPTSNTPSVSSTFNWTPAANQLGSYILQYSAVSATGLQSLLNININVTNNSPTLTCAPIGIIPATGPTGATVALVSDLADADDDLLTFNLTIDGVPQAVATGINPPVTRTLSRLFSLGTHTYTAQVTDSFSPTVTCSGSFTVKDLAPPTLTMPADITLVATSASGAVATFAATATDTIDATPTVVCTPASGSTFPVGSNFVTCTATDDALNSVSDTFEVNVLKAATTFEPLAVTPATVGSTLGVNTRLLRTSMPAGPLVGSTVRFVATGPSPSTTETVLSTTTTFNGSAFVGFTGLDRGAYTVAAYFDGEPSLTASSVGPAPAAVYQRTQLIMIASSGTAGEPLNEVVELRMQPQNAPLAGKIVHFNFAGANPPPPADVATDAAGQALITRTFASAGPYVFTATFNDAADFFTDAAGSVPPVASTGIETLTINPVVSTLSGLNVDSLGFVTGNLPVTTSLSRSTAPAGPLAGRIVTFTLTLPDTTTTTLTATTLSDGTAGVVFPLATRGMHSVVATYSGDSAITASSSNTRTIQVYQRTQLTLSPAIGTAGSDLSLTATLMLVPQNVPLAGQSVTISSIGFLPQTQSALTGGSGVASVSGTYATHGSFVVTATFDGTFDNYTNNVGTFPATAESTSGTATISAATTNLVVTAPTSGLVAGTIGLNAVLTRTAVPAGPVEGLVTFTVTSPSLVVSTIPASADASGVALATFTTNERGIHTVSATFDGDATHAASTSTPVSIGVYQRALLTLAPVAGGTNALPVIATLVAMPQNTPLSNETVQFSFGGVVPPQSASTDANGVATVSVAFPSVGTFGAHAAFSNAANFLTDAAGSLPPAPSFADAVVTISDSTPPVIASSLTGTPGDNGWYRTDVIVNWTVTDSESAATATGCDTATINTDGTVTLTCSATSAGGPSTSSVVVKRDTAGPSIVTPGNVSVPATSTAGAVVTYAAATATDGVSGLLSVSCAPVSGSTFTLGTHTVTCTATDNAGNISSAGFSVTVTDSTPPVITRTVTGTLGLNGFYTSDVVVSWNVTDAESAITSPACATTTTNTDGVAFTFTCSATSAGGTTSQTFAFKRDASAPSLTVSANKTDNADSWDGADVTYTAPVAADAVSGIASVSCTPASGSTFPIGVRTVTCVATNKAGLTRTATFTVTIVDNSEPGKMYGAGEVPGPNSHKVEFDVVVYENRRGFEWGDVRIKVRDTRRRRGDDERFDARTVDDVFFSNAPEYGPGHNSKTGIDTVIFRGTGKWDGHSNYRYIVTASDRGEPGRGRDTFTIQIIAPNGTVVFNGGGTLTDGNVQSSRLQRPWSWWNGHHGNSWHW